MKIGRVVSKGCSKLWGARSLSVLSIVMVFVYIGCAFSGSLGISFYGAASSNVWIREGTPDTSGIPLNGIMY